MSLKSQRKPMTALKNAIPSLLRTLYTACFYLALPFVFARFKWRGRRLAEYNQGWLERLGRGPAPHPSLKQSLWVQATSVGETHAAAPLIKALQTQYPELPIVVTNTTPTGLATVKQLLGDTVTHHYFPLDIPAAMKAFIRRFNPALAIMMETEIWPNLLHSCHRHSIPVLLANARLSERSAKRYRYVKALIKPTLTSITHIAAQTHADAQRFIALGASPKRVSVAGNLKCNVRLPDNVISQASLLKTQLLGRSKRPIFTIASLHYSELTIALEALVALKKIVPNVLLLLVPRKPEDFDTIARHCQQQGFSMVRYSTTAPDQYAPDADIFLGDTLGKLFLFYALSDVVFVAGSLVPHIGGHSLIEPALLAKPIITGTHTDNWTGIADSLLKAHALHKVENARALADIAAQLLQDTARSQQLGHRAKQVIDQQTQAVQEHMLLVRRLLFTRQKCL